MVQTEGSEVSKNAKILVAETITKAKESIETVRTLEEEDIAEKAETLVTETLTTVYDEVV